MVAVCAVKYFTELFTPKPQAPNLLPTRSDLILEEFSKELPFDQRAGAADSCSSDVGMSCRAARHVMLA